MHDDITPHWSDEDEAWLDLAAQVRVAAHIWDNEHHTAPDVDLAVPVGDLAEAATTDALAAAILTRLVPDDLDVVDATDGTLVALADRATAAVNARRVARIDSATGRHGLDGIALYERRPDGGYAPMGTVARASWLLAHHYGQRAA